MASTIFGGTHLLAALGVLSDSAWSLTCLVRLVLGKRSSGRLCHLIALAVAAVKRGVSEESPSWRLLLCWFVPCAVSGCSASYAAFRRLVNSARSAAVRDGAHRFSAGQVERAGASNDRQIFSKNDFPARKRGRSGIWMAQEPRRPKKGRRDRSPHLSTSPYV